MTKKDLQALVEMRSEQLANLEAALFDAVDIITCDEIEGEIARFEIDVHNIRNLLNQA